MTAPKLRLDVETVSIGWAYAEGVILEPASAELVAEIEAECARAKTRTPDTTAVRDMLRFGVYKPTGRGKPASEYLLNAAKEDRFPRINNLVDLLNLISLRYLLPISLLDLDKITAREFVVRRGRAGESYVFNSAAQTIELQDLLLTASLPDDVALANPVKDSMVSKLGDRSSAVLGVVYAPKSLGEHAAKAAQDLSALLARYGSATSAIHGAL